MCFSAVTSFGLSAVLAASSVITLKRVQTSSQVPFAAIPLIFAIQQFVEGILWISFTNSTYAGWNHYATLIFLVFAQVIWPFLVPYSMFMLEKVHYRRNIFKVLVFIGFLTSLHRTYGLINFPIHSDVNSHHIRYLIDFNPQFNKISLAFYFVSIIIPSFISSVKYMVFIGVFLIASFTITYIFYGEYIISVWCYFAAAISVIVILISSNFRIRQEGYKE
ncbi:MAG: hypothetical protein RI883_846 [Bacteroidota bacterium]|jgi:hypothetical protein